MSEDSENPYERPLMVSFVAVLYALMGLIAIIAGIAIVIGGTLVADDVTASSAIGIVLIIPGIICFVLCAGFLKGWSVMWYLGVIFTVLSIIAGVAVMIALGSLVMVGTLIIDVIILLYLFKSNVKLFFLKHE